MAHEIEHKYLVVNNLYKEMSTDNTLIIQGYIDRDPCHVVRIRKRGDDCFLTVKGKNKGDTRLEYEYEIPENDFPGLLSLCSGRILEKRRWFVPFHGHIWEVDEFLGDLKGMTVAEIELPSSDTEYDLPPFVGENVTGNIKYYNSNL